MATCIFLLVAFCYDLSRYPFLLSLSRVKKPCFRLGNMSFFFQEKEYAVDCWNLRWDAIKGRLDVFVLAHFLGYVSKAVMMRSSALCWTISIMWEITEMLFMHVLPNFEECLWDQVRRRQKSKENKNCWLLCKKYHRKLRPQ